MVKQNNSLLSSLLICGFRPFFVLTVISGCIFIPIWLLSLQGWIGYNVIGGWVLWHAHELIYGFASAATAGFALTAVPEFTRTRFIECKPLFILSALWVLARVAYLLSAFVSIWPAFIFNTVFWLLLLLRIFPPIWQQVPRRHTSIFIVVSLLLVAQICFFISLSGDLIPLSPLQYLYIAVHLFMILIVVAVSRVSTSVVNNLVESDKSIIDPEAKVYIARPARRNMVIACISVCAVSEAVFGNSVVTAWVALACMASVLNLLNDWHIGRALLNRFAIFLYASYWLMALGYAALAAVYFGASLMSSAARHLLMVGTMGLLIFTIMSIVGRIHSGLFLDRRIWLPIAAFSIFSASLVRFLAGFYALMPWYLELLWLAAVLWVAGFVMYAIHYFDIFFNPRIDNQSGCAGPKH